MFNFKIIVGTLVVLGLVLGGVIDIKVYPAEIPKAPSRLLALVQGEELLEQGYNYVNNIFSFMKSDEEKEDSEEDSGEVAGASDDSEEEDKKINVVIGDAKKESAKDFQGIAIPLRF